MPRLNKRKAMDKGGKGNKFRKNYNRGGVKKADKRKDKHDPAEFSKIKKFKYMARNKDAAESLMRQKTIEKDYQQKYSNLADHYGNESEEEERIDPFEELLSSLETENRRNKNRAIESSSEEEDDGVDTEEESIVDDEIVEEEDDDDSMEDDASMASAETENDEDDSGDAATDDDDESNAPSVIAEDETEEGEKTNIASDPFTIHLEYDLSPELLDSVISVPRKITNHQAKWPELGSLSIDIPNGQNDTASKKQKGNKKALISLDDEQTFASEGNVPQLWKEDQSEYIKAQIEKNVATANSANLSKRESNLRNLTPLQSEMYSIMNNYQDLYHSKRTLKNGEEIRFTYCLHALNHVLKTRTKILNHNARIAANSQANKSQSTLPDYFQDQGLVRPKVLIILPFRDAAYRVVNNMIKLLVPEMNGTVMNYKRFEEEFTGETLIFSEKHPKPEDYEKTFAGNTDDTFRIGIALTKKTIKLYSDFYSSDILIASPLGLRLIIGAPGEKDRDYDFLSSLELLIIDQSEILLAQNWDHILHTFEHLHLQPKSARNTDFSRIRSWSLNGWAKYYRQTILLSSHELPEFRALFNNQCNNYRGRVRIANPIPDGTVRNVIVSIPQMFHRIEVSSLDKSFDTRFNYFVSTILPQFKSPTMSHCAIYIPSYFDFVRIRNYFKKETISFVQICEYTKEEKVTRARDKFFHSSAHFLLYSERTHFFKRMRIKGIRHLIFYQPPNWPNFYAEVVNFMQEANQNKSDGGQGTMTVSILYSKFDVLQLAEIVGSAEASKMLGSEKSTHMFMTGG